VQAVGDGVFAVVNEVEDSADLGEGERDKASADGGAVSGSVGLSYVFSWGCRRGVIIMAGVV
jgi:hypothetical protein